MKMEGAIFDMDGTLLNSMYLWDTLGEDYLIDRGITPEEGLNGKFKSMSLFQAAEYYRRVYGLRENAEEIIDDISSRIARFYAETVLPKPGVPELLRKLRGQGVRMCVATATDRHMTENALRRCGLLDCFLGIFTCREVGSGKDSPEIFERALAYLGTDRRHTVVFEDAPYAMKTAKAAGFPVVGVSDPSWKDKRDEAVKAADIYLATLENWDFRAL
jgi:HAD superfamily hydrolase (TIGR01509 family)